MQDDLSIIIPCAGPNKRFKGNNPKCLARLRAGDTVLQRQIKILHYTFPSAEIIIPCGFQAERILKSVPSFVKTIFVEDFDKVNEAYSIQLAISQSNRRRFLIVYGDLVFADSLFASWQPDNKSCIWVDTLNQLKRENVGITSDNGKAVYLWYGLPNKWCQIVYLQGRELTLFTQLFRDSYKKKYCGHEAINDIIALGGEITVLEQGVALFEIDLNKDVSRINKLI